MASLDELPQEFHEEGKKVYKRLVMSCYHKTEQGIVRINELISIDDVLKETLSSGTLSESLSRIVTDMLNFHDSSDRQDSPNLSSAIEKLASMNINTKALVDCFNDRPVTHALGQVENTKFGHLKPNVGQTKMPC